MFHDEPAPREAVQSGLRETGAAFPRPRESSVRRRSLQELPQKDRAEVTGRTGRSRIHPLRRLQLPTA